MTALVPWSGVQVNRRDGVQNGVLLHVHQKDMVHENSKNSQITPMVMEKQKATTAMKKGDKFRDTRSLRLSRSTKQSQ